MKMASEEKYSFQTGEIKTFHVVDYVLFGLTLAFSASIGIFYAIKDRRRVTTEEFLLAGRNMNPIPVALSLLASFMSAITMLGTPAEMYKFTTVYFWIGLGYFFVVAGAAHIYVPIFYRLNVTSVYEYLEYRFSKGVRTAASMTFVLQMILYMAIVLYAPSLALNAVTGFSLWGAIISVGSVCILYTALGGMKAVLWTDTFQVGMMFAGILAVLISGSMRIGGFGNAWALAQESGRVVFDDFSPDPAVRHSVWSLVIGGFFTWVAIYGTNQAQVQRACTCPTLKRAQIALWINFPGLCLIMFLGCFIGIAVYGFYSTCDPLKFKLITASDQLLPLFVMDVLGNYPGIPGVFVAGIFSGCLSTLSSGLNSISAAVLQDVIKAYIWKDLSEKKATYVSKVIAIVFGIICLGLTYVASLLGSVLQAALSLFGMIGGPLLGLFTMGMMFPWANKWGAYSGLFVSLIFMFWIGIGAQVYKPPNPLSIVNTTGCNWTLRATPAPPFYENTTVPVTTLAPQLPGEYKLYTLSYLWYSATAVLTTCVVGLLVSFATGFKRPSEVDARLICPLFDVICPYLPEKILKPLRFGVNHKGKYDTAFIPPTVSKLPLKLDSAADLPTADTNPNFSKERETDANEDGNVRWDLDTEYSKAIDNRLPLHIDQSNTNGKGDDSGLNNDTIPPSYEDVLNDSPRTSTRL